MIVRQGVGEVFADPPIRARPAGNGDCGRNLPGGLVHQPVVGFVATSCAAERGHLVGRF